MKKNKIISLIVLSFLLSAFIFIRVNFVKNIRSWESYLLASIIGITAVAMLVLAYRMILKRLQKGELNQADYAKLFELEKNPVTDEVEFYFTIESAKTIKFSILSDMLAPVLVLKEEAISSGGHIIRFDTHQLTNGIYFFCLETENQKTMKKMKVFHDKVSV
jgi:riboflavin transporter FmnP